MNIFFFFQELLIQTNFLRKLVQEQTKCCCENIEIFLPFINQAVLEFIVKFMYTGDLSGSEDTIREGIDVLVNQFGFPQDLKKINFLGDKNSPEISPPIPGTSNSARVSINKTYKCECGSDFVTPASLNIHRKKCEVAKKQAEETLTEQHHDDEWIECQAKPHCSKPVNLGANWVQCDLCKNWLHNFCIGIGPDSYPDNEDYICKVCNPNFKPWSPGPPSFKSAAEDNASHQQPDAQYDIPNESENQSFVDNIVIGDVQGGVLDPELKENALSNGVMDDDDGGLFSSEDETEEPRRIFEFEAENRHPMSSSGDFDNVNTQPKPSGSSNSGSTKVVTPLRIKIPKPSKKRSIEGTSGKQNNGNLQDPANPPPAKRPRRPLEKVFCLACNEEIPKNQKLRHAVSHYDIRYTRHKDKLIHTDTLVKCAIPGCDLTLESRRTNKAKLHLFQSTHKDLDMLPEMIEDVYGKFIRPDQPRDNVDVGFCDENPNLHLIQSSAEDPGP